MRFKNKRKRQVSGHYHWRRELAQGLWPVLWVQRLDLVEHPENTTEDSGLRPRRGLAGKGLVWGDKTVAPKGAMKFKEGLLTGSSLCLQMLQLQMQLLSR